MAAPVQARGRPGPPLSRGRRNRMGIICSVRTTTADLQAVMNAKTLPGVRFEPRCLPTLVTDYPKAVSCLRDNLDELLTW